MSDLRHKIYRILDGDDYDTPMEIGVNLFLICLILLNVGAVIAESIDGVYRGNEIVFERFELFSVVIFLSEYLARLWVCTLEKKYEHPVKGRLRYMATPLALVDLVAITPFFLLGAGLDLRTVRILRLVRLFRIAKLTRYYPALRIFANAIQRRTGELVVTGIVMFFLIILASSLMYFAEKDAQPDVFSSIPDTMIWSMAVLGKVSIGDIKPITQLGKILAAIISIFGIAIFAIPAGIIGSGFVEEYNVQRNTRPTAKNNSKQT